MIQFMNIDVLMSTENPQWCNWKIPFDGIPSKESFELFIFRINGVKYLEWSEEFEKEIEKAVAWEKLRDRS